MKKSPRFQLFPNSGHALFVALLVVLVFACSLAPLSAAPLCDSKTDGVHAAASPALQGTVFQEIAGNRSRMIQVAAIFVVLGFFILSMKYR
jgi:hypothetical protein